MVGNKAIKPFTVLLFHAVDMEAAQKFMSFL